MLDWWLSCIPCHSFRNTTRCCYTTLMSVHPLQKRVLDSVFSLLWKHSNKRVAVRACLRSVSLVTSLSAAGIRQSHKAPSPENMAAGIIAVTPLHQWLIVYPGQYVTAHYHDEGSHYQDPRTTATYFQVDVTCDVWRAAPRPYLCRGYGCNCYTTCRVFMKLCMAVHNTL